MKKKGNICKIGETVSLLRVWCYFVTWCVHLFAEWCSSVATDDGCGCRHNWSGRGQLSQEAVLLHYLVIVRTPKM